MVCRLPGRTAQSIRSRKLAGQNRRRDKALHGVAGEWIVDDGQPGDAKLALGPYELKSFAAPFGKPKNLSGESR